MVTDTVREKILIVDDEAGVRRAVRKGLSSVGYECLELGDPVKALNFIQVNDPDLVILDIMMPGKSGRELLPEIITSHPRVAVIMSTAVLDPKTIIECMRNGAQDYITKPFEMDEIIQRVDKVLEMKRLEKHIGDYQRQLELTVNSQKSTIREMFLNSVEALVHALEAKDKYTAGHSRRVTRLAVAIGQEMNLSHDELEELRWGGLLHDVGKIAIDPAIQNKTGDLTSEEYRHMMTHAMVGGGIVKPLANQIVIDIIVHHHDHFDGTGIEQRIKGEEIPLGARIVALADSFDAMTSDRPYRKALSTETALGEIKRCINTQFDPSVVKAFLKLSIAEMVFDQKKDS
jgi:putative two-component system response regulator